MSRHYYCSTCGLELILKRKALRNKQVVIDILDPHTCDEDHKNIANITDDEKPSTPFERQVKQESNLRLSSVRNIDDNIFQDQRDKKFMREDLKPVTSTAPFNVISQVKGGIATRPERPISEIEDEEA
jgi:hypothetical protein